MDNETKDLLRLIARALVAIAEASAERLDMHRVDDRQAEYTDAAIAAMRSQNIDAAIQTRCSGEGS